MIEATKIDLIQLPNQEITQNEIDKVTENIVLTQTPLRTYIWVKAFEKIAKTVIADKAFRKRVREDFLSESGGDVTGNKKHFYGVEVATISKLKANTLAKPYLYSQVVEDMEKEIEVMESDLEMRENALKLKKQGLEAQKLIEINGGIATEITTGSILDVAIQEAEESQAVNDFELKITFPKK